MIVNIKNRELLRRKIMESGLTPNSLARKMDITPSTIYSYLDNDSQRNPSPKYAKEISKELNIPFSSLFEIK